MASPDWSAVGHVDVARLSAARLQTHFAAQWLARAARAFIPPQPDDSHTNLGWDHELGGFATHPLPDGARLSLRFVDLSLVLIERDGRRQALALGGRTDTDARKWLGDIVSARGLDAGALDAPSPYEMPAHAIAQDAAYDAAIRGALTELAAWYTNATVTLGWAREQFGPRSLGASPVRCWPHHFDLDTLLPLAPENARYIGVGFSPGDEYYEEPYFYVMAYPYPDEAARARLPAIGQWHTHEFTAAVACASRIVAATDRKGEVEAFLAVAIEGGIQSSH